MKQWQELQQREYIKCKKQVLGILAFLMLVSWLGALLHNEVFFDFHFQFVKFWHFGIKGQISLPPKASLSDKMRMKLQSNQLYYKVDLKRCEILVTQIQQFPLL